MIRRILLDLDDVLNQFTMNALKIVGCDVDPMDNSQFPVEVGYDIVAACNLLHPTKQDWTAAEFWKALPREAWSETPLSPECGWLVDACARMVGKDNVFICTSAVEAPECAAAKREWMLQELPSWIHWQYAITPCKFLAANDFTLLIDDCEGNCVAFENAGGNSLLVPKPWNPNHSINTQAFLSGFWEERNPLTSISL